MWSSTSIKIVLLKGKLDLGWRLLLTITKALSRRGICPDYCHWLPAIGVAAPVRLLALSGCGASGGGRVWSVLGTDSIACWMCWLFPRVPCKVC